MSLKRRVGILLVLLAFCLVLSTITTASNSSLETVLATTNDVHQTSDGVSDFEIYLDRILDEFNVTYDVYTQLNESDRGKIDTFVYALWGYENGTLTAEEANAMVRSNTPSTTFTLIFGRPTSMSITAKDSKFSVDFRAISDAYERITGVKVYFDSNPDLNSLPTTHQMYLDDTYDLYDKGHIDTDGKTWIGHPWGAGIGIYPMPLLVGSGFCDFQATITPGFISDWVKFFIVYRYQYFTIYPLGWNTDYETHPFNIYWTGDHISISDDDTTGPVIDASSLEAGLIGDEGGLIETYTIFDNESLYAFQCDLTEWVSEISYPTILIDGVAYTYYGDAYKDEYGFQWCRLGNDGSIIGLYSIVEHPLRYWEYRLYVVLYSPGATLGLGSHTIGITVNDNDNDRIDGTDDTSVSNSVSFQFEVIDDDTDPPEVNLSVGEPYFSDGGFFVSIEIYAEDPCGVNGVSILVGSTYYSGALGVNTIPLNYGVNNIQIRVFDKDNDRNNDYSVAIIQDTIVVDTQPPVTTISLVGNAGLSGWYTSDVQATMIATDDLSGIDSTYYRIGFGPLQKYIVPFSISGDGVHTISFYSVDLCGNVETMKSKTVRIDTASPTTSIFLDGVLGLGGWFVSDVSVSLNAIDSLSGVLRTEYSLNGIDWMVYSTPITITTNGINKFYYRSIDFAGNVEEESFTEICIYFDASINVDPDALNTKSEGEFVTVYIQLPTGYDPSTIDISTIELRYNDKSINAVWAEVQDGILMVKFDRASLIEMVGDVASKTVVELEIWCQ
ncbi:MAG: OmpL47-type beta-barrel domain-containing protein, partial [Candidatus Thorarchaeota archaeon]